MIRQKESTECWCRCPLEMQKVIEYVRASWCASLSVVIEQTTQRSNLYLGRLLNLCIGESFRIPGMTYSKLILRMDVLGVESFRRSQSEPLERDINHARYDYDKLRVHSMAIFP
jgi:hypothetical protein